VCKFKDKNIVSDPDLYMNKAYKHTTLLMETSKAINPPVFLLAIAAVILQGL